MTRNVQSNIALCLREFQRAKPEGTPKGKGLYLTLIDESIPNTDIIELVRIIMVMIPSLISLAIIQYTTLGVYCEIYPLLEVNIARV